MKVPFFCSIAGLALGLASGTAQAISLTGGLYVEDFNSMGPSGTVPPTDWVVVSTVAANPVNPLGLPSGPSANIGNNGYNAGRIAGNVGDGDRALGVYGGSVGDTRKIRATFTNNTGAAVNSFTLQYDLEVWYFRFGSALPASGGLGLRLNGVDLGATFDAAVTNASLPPTQPDVIGGAGEDGLWLNDPLTVLNVGGLVTPVVPIAAGASFTLEWDATELEPEPLGTNTSRRAVVSLDNVRINFGSTAPTAPAIPEPASILLGSMAIVPLLLRRRAAVGRLS